MTFLALFVAGLLTFGCSQKVANQLQTNTQQTAIINGIPVTAENALAKSVVGLMAKYDEDTPGAIWIQNCTGSILNSKFILTAAHCVEGSSASELLVHFSLKTVTFEGQQNPVTRVDVEKTMVTRKVKAFKTHPDYTGTGSYDLALLMLVDEAPADVVFVQLLPAQFYNVDAGLTTFEGTTWPILLMGFGLVSEAPTYTDVLRETTVPAKFADHFVVTNQTKGSGGCSGDSGGPAFLTIDKVVYQVGVTHGPRAGSTTCHEEGEWYNPVFDKGFLKKAQSDMQTEVLPPTVAKQRQLKFQRKLQRKR